MKLWQQMISTAIVGTERQKFELPPPADGDAVANLLGALAAAGDETRLLKAAAVLGSYLRSGIAAAPDAGAAPEPAGDETRASIPPLSENHLAAMLAGHHSRVLREFFELVAENGRVLPPPFLPAALDEGTSKSELRPFIVPILGARGRWLAGRRDDWSWAVAAENQTEKWETGARAERLAALAALRREDPAAARELLAAGWSAESAKDRAAFLEVLKTNLDAADGEFLERVRQTDKSADARRAAVNLLLKIPGSPLRETLAAEAAALLVYKPGGFLSKAKLEVVFPADFDRDAKGDPLADVELFLNERELGKKAVRLVKLLHAVPPRFWEERFGAPRETLVEAAKNTDWKNAVLTGFRAAALNFADAEWLAAVLPESGQNDYYTLSNQIERDWRHSQIENLIEILLDGEPKTGLDRNFAVLLFNRLKERWSDEFSLKISNFLERESQVRDFKEFIGKEFIGIALPVLNSGHLFAVGQLADFELRVLARLAGHLDKLPGYARSAEDFAAVAAFRRELRAAFRNEEKL
ncbi:MAG: hypothetical protein JSS81_22920 [Acidobacteria bacterium]|nr:hypothetical protein [Acidobacteriota bacterium]